MSVPPSVPEGFACTQVSLRGEAGLDWLDCPPALTEEISHRWSLKVGNPLPNFPYNWVVPALHEDGTQAVLKLSLPGDKEFATEAAALAVFDGRGICGLLDLDRARGAMLPERLQPGAPLAAIEDDEEATALAAGVVKNLRHLPPSDHAFPTVSDWAAGGFECMRSRFDVGAGPMPEDLVGEAEMLFAELLASERGISCTAKNILWAGDESWLAIDPKGVGGLRGRLRPAAQPGRDAGRARSQVTPRTTARRSLKWAGARPRPGTRLWPGPGRAGQLLTGVSKTAAGCGTGP